MPVDLTTNAPPRRSQMAWWDRKQAPKVSWAERREEIVLVVHVTSPKDAEVSVRSREVSFKVKDTAGEVFTVTLPLKGEVETDEFSWSTEVGSTSVRVRLKKTKASKGLWQDEFFKKGAEGGNNTCLTIDPKKSKNWLAYDWEVYKEEEEDELEDEHYEDPDDEPIHQLPSATDHSDKELRAQREKELDEREEELRREAEALRARSAQTKDKAQMMQFTFEQLQVLLVMSAVCSSFVSFLFARWMYNAGAPSVCTA
eukprot:Hpha_TRINITY_DN14147_c0_g1::TRINITY_DN14147_c0_g1_i1::g.11071::m.11071